MRTEQLELPFFTRYNPPPSPGLDTGPDSLTHAECAQECDINYIMRRYAADGVLPNNGKVPLDGAIVDFVGQDFMDLQNRMIQAREEFEALPSSVRDRFGNDPARLIAFLGDEKNRDEALRLGLIEKTPPSGGEGAPPQRGEGAKDETAIDFPSDTRIRELKQT